MLHTDKKTSEEDEKEEMSSPVDYFTVESDGEEELIEQAFE